MKRVNLLHGIAIAGWLVAMPGNAASPEEDLPGDAFLEFLGSWETVDGEWIDPVELAELGADKKVVDDGAKVAEEVREDNEDES